jgi:3-oxoacyl-[acyl-carrier protein] reductase
MRMAEDGRSALVFGARNLGRAIIETLSGAGWSVAGVARSDRTLEGVTAAGALAIRADVTIRAASARRSGRRRPRTARWTWW